MTEMTERGDVRTLRQIALAFLVCAVVFFPLIFNPILFGFFDAETDEELRAHVAEHLTALRLVFTGIGLTELALGAALWRWGTVVAAVTPGRRGSIATYLARGAAAAGVIALLGRLSSWVQDVDQLAASDFGAIEVIVGLGAGLGFSLAFIGYGVLMIRGEMPTSLGVVWVLSGLLYWAGILPLWFFFGALVFGIVGLIRFRGMRAGANRVAGIKRTAPVPESLPST